MGTFDWQTIAALLCVMAASAFMLRRIRCWLHGKAPSACHSCPARQTKPESPLISLNSLKMSPTLQSRQKK